MFTTGLIVGIFIGLLLTSRHFRVNITRRLKIFVAWIKDVIERNKKMRNLQEENKRLHGICDNISHVKRIG
jgi:MFS superfamily sulfate permease-like transporter